jgi:hypothetical protein
MRITLTAGQAVSIHGWWKPKSGLTWGDVISNEALGFTSLLAFNLTENDLYVLQPDLQAWVRTGKATLQDCPRMRRWDAHPIKDFKADLSDIIRAEWSSETMARTGLTFEELRGVGLTVEAMPLMNYTLMMWANIGFKRHHADEMPHNLLFTLFGMSKQDVLSSLRTQ